MEPPLYTNLKRPTMQPSDEYAPANNNQNNGHTQSTANQSLRSDSVHFLHLTASPAHLSPPPPSDESPLISTYQPNYTFSTNIDNHDMAAPDYANDMSPTSANNVAIHLNGLNNATTGTHQRRGSVQLWQFLVELLNEPEFR